MRSALTIGRLVLRQAAPFPRQCVRNQTLRAVTRNSSTWTRGYIRRAPGGVGGTSLLLAAALSPAVFVQLSEEDNDGTEQTAEGRMLEASRQEISKTLAADDHGFSRFRHAVVLYLDVYLWEPLCTGLRFLHLVVIFVPVIVTVPAMWLGTRDKERDSERTGTLWWYRFLVQAMERAGPAFIKVCLEVGFI